MLVTPHFCKNTQKPLGHPTGQNTPKSNFFCQQNLTKPSISLLNRDTYPNFTQMGINKGAALGTMMMGALVAPEALAGDKTGEIKLAAATTSTSQQVDCVAYAKQGATRAEKKDRLKECRLGKLDSTIAEQERVIAALNEILAKQQLRIDELGVIRDANNQELARVVAINGKLLVQRQQLEQRIADANQRTAAAEASIAQTLDEIEAFIRSQS